MQTPLKRGKKRPHTHVLLLGYTRGSKHFSALFPAKTKFVCCILTWAIAPSCNGSCPDRPTDRQSVVAGPAPLKPRTLLKKSFSRLPLPSVTLFCRPFFLNLPDRSIAHRCSSAVVVGRGGRYLNCHPDCLGGPGTDRPAGRALLHAVSGDSLAGYDWRCCFMLRAA